MVDPAIESGEPRKKDSPLFIIVIVAVCLLGFCAVTAVIAAIAIPNLMSARKASNEAAAIGALRMVTTAQLIFREGDKDQDGTLDYATDLRALSREGLVDPTLAGGSKQGYLFRIERADEKGFSATAIPAEPGKSGSRSFYIDESGVIRFRVSDGEPATERDPPISR